MRDLCASFVRATVVRRVCETRVRELCASLCVCELVRAFVEGVESFVCERFAGRRPRKWAVIDMHVLIAGPDSHSWPEYSP